MSLRPYQENGLIQIRELYRKETKKVLLWLATGGGKTVVFCEILKSVYERKKRALMIVRGRKLVKQASQRLAREGVPHGIMMAGSDRGHDHRILCCSIDTLRSRGYVPEADLIVLDEVHLATSESYVQFLKNYPNAYLLGVTATPFGDKPLRHCADEIVCPITMGELIDQGFLVPPKYFAPVETNLSGVQIDSKTKDYNQRQLSNEMDKMKLVGDIVESWKKYGQDRSAVCFAVTVEHSKHIAEQFNAAGIAAAHCDADTPENYRDHCLERLRTGSLKILSNVGLFGIGVDMPFLSCLILARPTLSLNLYIQQVGRGLRPYENKTNCLILDHAGNVLKHGFVTDDHEPSLDGTPKKSKVKTMRCKECFAVVQSLPCEFCGWTAARPGPGGVRGVNHVEGELQELSPRKIEVSTPEEIKTEIERLDRIASLRNFKAGWIWHQVKTKYGAEVAKFYLAERFKRPSL